MNVMPGQRSAGIVNGALGTDVEKAIAKPKEGKEIVVSEKGKIQEITHKKIFKGELSNFSKNQNSIVRSILDTVEQLKGSKINHGGDKKVTNLIYKAAVKELSSGGKDSQTTREALAGDMLAFASRLSDEISHRLGEVKIEAGVIDSHVLRYLRVTEGEFQTHMQKQYSSLEPLISTAQDINRYGVQKGQIKVINQYGQNITPPSDNIFDYVNATLERSMIQLGMLEDGVEPILNKQAQNVLDTFHAKLQEKMGKEKELSGAGPDEVRDVLNALIKELKSSNDPKMKKLAFTLFGMNQCWVVQTGAKFGLIAKEAFGHDRFEYSAQAQLSEYTRYELQFDDEGGVTLSATGAFTNKDYKTAGEDYTAFLTTTASMKPDGDEKLKMTFDILVELPPGKIQTPQVQKFRQLLTDAGFNPTFKTVDATPKKQALVATALITAIRNQNITKEGIFREVGKKSVYESLPSKLTEKADIKRPEEPLLSEADMDKLDRNNLTSALKYLLREEFHLVSGEANTKAFLDASDKEVPASTMRKLVDALPVERQAVIRNLCQMCHEITKHADKNLMTASNLAIVMGPSIFSEADPMQFAKQQQAFLKILEAFPKE